jgi:hypothetical protein
MLNWIGTNTLFEFPGLNSQYRSTWARPDSPDLKSCFQMK